VLKRTVTFQEDIYAKLEIIAKEKGLPVSAIIKIACSEYIEKEQNK